MSETYLAIATEPLNSHRDVSRTIQIAEHLLVDVDADGYVVGVENLAGPIGMAELIEVLQSLSVDPSAGGTR